MATKGVIAPERLPPTERAAFYHGLRVYFQIIVWSLIKNFEMDALNWGWIMNNGMLVPIRTDKDVAPDCLTKVIRCNCKVNTSHRICTELNIDIKLEKIT